jgi:hypothetical protein
LPLWNNQPDLPCNPYWKGYPMRRQHTTAGMLGAALLVSALGAAQAQQAHPDAKADGIQKVNVVSQRNPSDWFIAESQHFVVYSDTSHEEVTRLLNNLERLDYLLRLYTKPYDKTGNSERKLTLYYAERVEDFDRLDLDAPVNAVGLYSSCAAGVEGVGVQLEAIDELDNARLAKQPLNESLSHIFEAYARHFLNRHTDIRAPIWFLDGFAYYFSAIRFTDDQLVVGRTPPSLGGYLEFLNQGHRYSLDYQDILNQNDSEGINYAKKSGLKLEYEARSWILVHYLLSTEDNRNRLLAYLKAFYGGEASAPAFEKAVGIKVGDLGTAMWQYRRMSSKVVQVIVPELPRAIVNFTGLPKAAGDFVLLDAALKACPARERREKLLNQVRSAAAQDPNNPTAQVTLARALVESGHGAEALPWLGKALASDAGNAELHLLAAQAHLDAAAQDGAAKAAHLADAERQLARAHALDPAAPDVALAQLRADLEASSDPSQAALENVIAAWHRERDVPALGKAAVLAYAWMGDGISSANLLKSMASNRRDPDTATWAADWQKRLDAGLTRADLRAGLHDGLNRDPWDASVLHEWTVAQKDVLQNVIVNAGLEDARHAIIQNPNPGDLSKEVPIPSNR